MNKIYSLLIFCLLCVTSFCQTTFTKTDKEISFKVDDVKPATTLLTETNLVKSLATKLKREIKFVPVQYQNSKVVQTEYNSFIGTIQNCYNDHRPLILTPEAIWLCITQGLSIHINQNFAKYKNQLFKDTSNEKIELLIREDSLSYRKDYWTKSIAAISNLSNEQVNKNYYNFFVHKFSTTDSVAITAMEITMLDAFKQKFIYVAESGCGIPTITIKGTTQDWQWIYNNLQQLNQFELNNWVKELQPIIKQFIAASQGKIDKKFWKDIYKNSEEYNAHYISGWVIKLFPYVEATESVDWNDTTRKDRDMGLTKIIYTANEYIYGNEYLKSHLSTDNFPSGISNIKLIWKNYYTHKTTDLELFAGFLGIKQHKDKSLEPFICWTLSDFSNNSFKPEGRAYIKMSHNKNYWSPFFAKQVTDSAVLKNKKYNTTAKSIEYIRTLIIKKLQENNLYNDTTYKGKTVLIEILSNGIMNLAYVFDTAKLLKGDEYAYQVNNSIPKLSAYITSIVQEVNEKWFPALAHPVDVLWFMDPSKREQTLKVKVNSFIKFVF